MGRRRNRKWNDNTFLIAILIGVPVFLLMNDPIIFWIVFIPIVVMCIVMFINWLTK